MAGVNGEIETGRSFMWRDLTVVLLVAVVLRVIVMLGMAGLPLWAAPEVDAAVFHASAQRIASGDLLLGHDVLRMSPGYFYFLGGVYAALGDGPLAFRLLQLVLGLLTVAATWSTARELFGRRTGLVVGVGIALYEPLAFYENLQLGETLATCLLSLLLWLAVTRVDDDGKVSTHVLAAMGAAFGLLCDVRPNALALGVPLGFFVWRASRTTDRRGRALSLALFLGCAGVALSPITLRNYAATSELTLTGHLAGLNFYMGNGKGASGTFRVPEEVPDAGGPDGQFAAYRRAAERLEGHPLTPKQTDDYWKRRTLESVLDDPLAWLALMFKKTRLFFNGRELSDIYDYPFLRTYSPWLGVPSLQFSALAPFACVGLVILLLQRSLASQLVAWVALTYAASIIAVFINGRFRLPIVPVLFLAAGACIGQLTQVLRARRMRQALGLLFALAATTFATWPVKLTKTYAHSWFTLGYGFHEQKRLQEAEHAYLSAIAIQDSHLPSHNNLALLYEAEGRRADALREWRAIAALTPKGSPEQRRAAVHILRLSRQH